MKRITIIGGGASGTLLAVNLIKHSGSAPLEINLVEKSKKIGRGVAYSPIDDIHLLNVPAAKMGAFPDEIEHFHKWLVENKYEYAPGDFVPRAIYGEYLCEVFADAIANKAANVSLNLLDDEAIDVFSDEGSALVLLESGEVLPSHKVVLAFGNFTPPDLPTETTGYTASEKYFRNSWDTRILEKVAPTDDVLLIGTGLSAVDNIMSFHRRDHRGKIIAVSKHGWFPAAHKSATPYQCFKEEIAEQKSVRQIFKTVRRHCRQAENWRSVIDALRPVTQETWHRLPTEEKRAFMRHLRRVWDISRHRMPPQCSEILDAMQREGKLEVRRGKIRDIQASGGKFEVKYSSKGIEKTFAVDAIINCVGSESNFEKIEFPLVKCLLEKGEIKPDALALGLDATPDGDVINRANEPSNVISTLGTALKGILWESTAMPEIRVQAKKLALRLLYENQNASESA
ncbi:MAG TPA: FAD/NAD(P)-binding protein [Pyrinomonadaceae bacterium]|jgi:uncharacterized NAD(P)/FAD-binding protein YdhS